ncbi:hypothetical protein CYMTET_53814 [Cymbomonas tetramitiformis]|uniref:Uncharacterized protein n=1 Tax=Cymbomonas tetramitiformis TaxID=36881 RepID=A0AAE0EPZ7_9CHLO|nr:hypothetical protein CYMTET_53814 [Cymbomonas tetramitiformis]
MQQGGPPPPPPPQGAPLQQGPPDPQGQAPPAPSQGPATSRLGLRKVERGPKIPDDPTPATPSWMRELRTKKKAVASSSADAPPADPVASAAPGADDPAASPPPPPPSSAPTGPSPGAQQGTPPGRQRAQSRAQAAPQARGGYDRGSVQEFMDGKPPLRQHIKLIVDMGYSFWEMLDGITGEELTNDARLFRQEDTTKYAPLVLGAAKMLIKEANARMGTGNKR